MNLSQKNVVIGITCQDISDSVNVYLVANSPSFTDLAWQSCDWVTSGFSIAIFHGEHSPGLQRYFIVILILAMVWNHLPVLPVIPLSPRSPAGPRAPLNPERPREPRSPRSPFSPCSPLSPGLHDAVIGWYAANNEWISD